MKGILPRAEVEAIARQSLRDPRPSLQAFSDASNLLSSILIPTSDAALSSDLAGDKGVEAITATVSRTKAVVERPLGGVDGANLLFMERSMAYLRVTLNREINRIEISTGLHFIERCD